MNQTDIACAKCGEAMEEGFLLEYGDGGTKATTYWVDGKPEKSFWENGLKIDNKRHFEVQTYRCENCGYLESYAKEN